MRRALALVTVLLVAGCLSLDPDGGGDSEVPRAAFIDPIDDGHAHEDLALHDLSTSSMHLIAYASLGDDAVTFTDFGELDFHGDRLAVAAVAHDGSTAGAVVIVDIADPAAPSRLGYVAFPASNGAHPLDVKWDEAGEFVYASFTGQIYAIRVAEDGAPTLAGAMLPPGAACHMSALGVVDGAEYFWCTGDGTTLTAYRVVATPVGNRALVPVGNNRPSEPPSTAASQTSVLGAPHDMTFQLDPVDGTPLLVVSNRAYGVRVLDVSNPALAVELGRWHGEGAEFFSNHVHTAMVAMVNGTRYVIASPEILTPDFPPAVWMLDATDYGALALAAEWVGPGEHPSPGFLLTTHQWQVAGERLYLGYYHAGVWVLDLKTILAGGFREDATRPDVLGYYLPHESPTTDGAIVPNVWDLNLVKGLMFVTDISSGLYVLHYAPDAVGDETLTGFS